MLRSDYINIITKSLSLIEYEIELRQELNDYSLNIYSENLFRDLLNEIYNYELENENKNDKNASYIDLKDTKNKIFFQITSTKTKEKIDNTLKILETYPNYTVKILFLLDKPNLKNSSLEQYKSKYNIEDINKNLVDFKDLLKYINDLEQDKLERVANLLDTDVLQQYTTEVVLNLIIKHILRQYKNKEKNYLEDFNNKVIDEKLKINKINEKICCEIKRVIDYRTSIERLNDDKTMTDLRAMIIDELYKNILIQHLKNNNLDSNNLKVQSVNELHDTFYDKFDFNDIINKLYKEISSYFEIKDFNEENITWIIIAYFFEICDVGAKK